MHTWNSKIVMDFIKQICALEEVKNRGEVAHPRDAPELEAIDCGKW